MTSLLEAVEPQTVGSSNSERHRVVIDTSVLVSAIFFGGKAEVALRHIIALQTIILSDFIVDEFVSFARATDPKTPQKLIRLLRSKLEKYCYDYTPDETIEIRDINDVDIVALAREYHALIVTGDQDLLSYRDHTPVAILSVADYTELFMD